MTATIEAPAPTKPCADCGAPERAPGSSYCRPCKRRKWNEWWHSKGKLNEELVERRAAFDKTYNRGWKLEKTYGITLEDFDRILESQGGVCAICKRSAEETGSENLHVDHDHTTGVVRGLLCRSCNRGIGYLADSPERLRSAVAYLMAGGQA